MKNDYNILYLMINEMLISLQVLADIINISFSKCDTYKSKHWARDAYLYPLPQILLPQIKSRILDENIYWVSKFNDSKLQIEISHREKAYSLIGSNACFKTKNINSINF